MVNTTVELRKRMALVSHLTREEAAELPQRRVPRDSPVARWRFLISETVESFSCNRDHLSVSTANKGGGHRGCTAANVPSTT